LVQLQNHTLNKERLLFMEEKKNLQLPLKTKVLKPVARSLQILVNSKCSERREPLVSLGSINHAQQVIQKSLLILSLILSREIELLLLLHLSSMMLVRITSLSHMTLLQELSSSKLHSNSIIMVLINLLLTDYMELI